MRSLLPSLCRGWWSQAIPLPETVFEYFWQGTTQEAPTLREIRRDGETRLAVLDVILEVPAQSAAPFEQESRVLGWDWGVRSLITVSVLEKPEGDEPYRQVSRPVFLDTGGIDGGQARLRPGIVRWGSPQTRAEAPRTGREHVFCTAGAVDSGLPACGATATGACATPRRRASRCSASVRMPDH